MSATDRVSALQGLLVDAAIPALLVSDLTNIRYLTGFSGSAGRLLVPATGEALLVTDGRYMGRAATEAPRTKAIADRSWAWLAAEHPHDQALAVEANNMSWAVTREIRDLLSDTELMATSGLVRQLRRIKDDGEIACIRRACDITVQAMDMALGWIAPGMTERKIARGLIDQMLDLGADGSAFEPIVAAGPNGAVPHHRPGDRPVQAGDLLTIDFGAEVGGYHADMTRTVALGEPDFVLTRIYDLVRAAQQAGVESCRSGTATSAVDRACRTVIDAAGHEEHFVHGTGHGVGLEIHEDPFLGAQSVGTLQERMTITVEPGVYVPGIGGVRIEDVVLIGTSGPERLTPSPHDLCTL